MEYRYSSIVDPALYETQGLCDGIDVRMHNETYREDRGAIRAHQDWNQHVSPMKGYKGTLGPKWSFMTVSVPECLPERLEVISYANEFAFLHDDVTDNVDQELGNIENDDMMEAFLEGARSGTINATNPDARRRGKKQIQAQLLREMIAIDREGALTTMKAWAKFVEVGSSRQHRVYTRLDDYLPYRIMDVGEMFWFGVVTFGMGIRIPEHEVDRCRELMRPAWIAAGLTNDLFSWPKEHEAAKRRGEKHVVNAIWVLMQERSCGAEEAQQICRKMIKEAVAEYVQIVRSATADESLSSDLRKYIVAMQYSISGNVVWSLTCPRYNPGVSFNERQLAWMQDGVPESAESSDAGSLADDSSSMESGASTAPSSLVGELKIAGSGIGDLLPLVMRLLFCARLIMEVQITLEPFVYVCMLPSKGIRSDFIDALNHWLQVPASQADRIKGIATALHNSSLLLDDFQDQSTMRRGKPAAHTIFGEGQVVNTASYCIMKTVSQMHGLADRPNFDHVLGLLMTLFVGQSYELHWKHNLAPPTLEEYVRMVDSSELPVGGPPASLDRLCVLLGRLFQIRDDHQNLVSADYKSQKGFCEDLDEGKYSLPLLHLLHEQPDNSVVAYVLSNRRAAGSMPTQHKTLILEVMQKCGSLEYTKHVLKELHQAIVAEMDALEGAYGSENALLRMLVEALCVW
ncbi:fusicoccadiene synthase [Macrophomina phaseolina]|uniref:Fusicoccadiene synthase n=1 Tax=Macrophomina phaseolina TaxID=35725 RepID=A0ABQ8FTV6_9PEZI|nr:fusicoccadiene synthase [Macrophomina phaseolina]